MRPLTMALAVIYAMLVFKLMKFLRNLAGFQWKLDKL
jgi:hypothetical protein